MSAQAMSITRRLFLRNTAAASAAVATVAAPATTPPVSGMDRIKLALDELRAAMDGHVSPQEGPWDVVLNCDRRRKVTAILVGGKVFFQSVDAGDALRGGAI